MKRTIVLLMLVIFGLAGCVTFPVQIKTHDEVLSSVGFAARAVAVYIKTKYAPEVNLYLDLADKVLNADTDKMLEEEAQKFVNELTSKIKDPVAREAVKAFVGSFEVDIDTQGIIFDPGARQTIRDAIKIIRDVLEG